MTSPRIVDGIAVHDLPGDPDAPTVLYAHATGFHAHCWLPVTVALPQFHNVAYDARGHGDSPCGADWDASDTVDWRVYGADAVAVAEALVDADPDHAPLLGVGHSMGGAALIMAALARPDLFRGLVVYEPIVLPPPPEDPALQRENPLAPGARRRRATFPDIETAIANFAGKAPMSAFAEGVVDAYVRYGFEPVVDAHGAATGEVTLKCKPEHEARTYEAGGNHGTWERVGELAVPIWVVSGATDEMQPSAAARPLAERMPLARYVELGHLGHFGPMQSPAEIAAIVTDADLVTR